VLAAAEPDPPARELARIQSLRSYLLFRSDDVGAFKQSALRSLELARTAGDDTLTSHAWAHLVAAAHRSGREDEATAYARQALRHAHESQDSALIAHALSLLAPSVPWEEGQPLYDEAIALLRGIGSRRQLCVLHSNMAVRAIAEGHYDEALALLRRAIPLAQEDGNPQLMSGCLGDIGLAELLSGEHMRAQDAFVNQIRLCRQHGFRWQAGEGLLGLAAIAAARGDRERAARLTGAAQKTGHRGLAAIEVELERRFLADAHDETWVAAFDAGVQLRFADAIRYALDEPATADAALPA
jgi:tetratricopeptide (TPR) repeat protein